MEQQLCVFCASSAKVDKKYFDATARFAVDAVKNGYEIIYGGGSMGLMGVLADSALNENGRVVGVIPQFMREVEWDHKGLTELIVVDDMRERKRRLIESAGAIVALPGGCGTLEELAEAITLKRLGKIAIPIVILNLDGFYNPLAELLEQMVTQNFMNEKHRQIWTFVQTPEEIIPAIRSAEPWSEDAIHFATA